MKLNLLSIAVLVCMAAPAAAQDYEQAAAKARVRLGPLKLNPDIALSNAGVDSNVFNSATPQSDYTMTVTPHADMWLQVGRSWLSMTAKEDLVYYQKFASERSANASYAAAVKVPLTRVTVTARTGYLNSRDRPGFEIDARSQHTQNDVGTMVETRLFGKTYAGVTASRATVTFDRGQLFNGSDLSEQLNRTMTDTGVTVRHQLTPLTSATVSLEHQDDTFATAHRRDSTSTRVAAGLKFDPLGIIGGTAQIGYRHFQPQVATIPAFDGATASVDVSYRALASTHVGVQVLRDVQYSYEFEQPYYLQTGLTASVAQQVGGPFDVVGRAGAHRLAYRGDLGLIALADRTDSLRIFGGGFGYRFNKGTRLGIDIDRQQRISDAPGRAYAGLRFGTSVRYGF